MIKHFGWLREIVLALVCCAVCMSPAAAAVKILGDFEGDLDSPYTADWSAGPLITAEFITASDPASLSGSRRCC
jgi:hypothetical protein